MHKYEDKMIFNLKYGKNDYVYSIHVACLTGNILQKDYIFTFLGNFLNSGFQLQFFFFITQFFVHNNIFLFDFFTALTRIRMSMSLMIFTTLQRDHCEILQRNRTISDNRQSCDLRDNYASWLTSGSKRWKLEVIRRRVVLNFKCEKNLVNKTDNRVSLLFQQ